MEAELKRRHANQRHQRREPVGPEAMLEDLLNRVRFGDYFECLDVPKDVGTSDVRESWLRLSSVIEDLRAATSGIEGAGAAIGQIERVASDAFEILSDPDLRLAYLRALD